MATLGARDFSSAVSGFCQVAARGFGQHRKFPPHARKTSGTQGTLWQVRQKLEERRQLLGETVADYYYDILSFCSRLNLPKSEWLYCFVRGLRPEIRDHVI